MILLYVKYYMFLFSLTELNHNFSKTKYKNFLAKLQFLKYILSLCLIFKRKEKCINK